MPLKFSTDGFFSVLQNMQAHGIQNTVLMLPYKFIIFDLDTKYDFSESFLQNVFPQCFFSHKSTIQRIGWPLTWPAAGGKSQDIFSRGIKGETAPGEGYIWRSYVTKALPQHVVQSIIEHLQNTINYS